MNPEKLRTRREYSAYVKERKKLENKIIKVLQKSKGILISRKNLFSEVAKCVKYEPHDLIFTAAISELRRQRIIGVNDKGFFINETQTRNEVIK